MRILLAPDKFKGTLTAEEVCQIIGTSPWAKQHELLICPMADGGEGTAQILVRSMDGIIVHTTAHDARMRLVDAGYGMSQDRKTVFIELASASGLWRLSDSERNPECTTTYGTGELIHHAVEAGAEEIILCCGGSATNDGGIGMAAALGFRFLDEEGRDVPPAIVEVHRMRKIVAPLPAVHAGVGFTVISDVDNPLTGPRGAAVVFGPQKGADPAMVVRLDMQLEHWGKLLQQYSGKAVSDLKGAGAGGGFTAGAVALLDAKPESGIEVVIRRTGLEEKVRTADLVITGEGQLDEQSLHGKVIDGVAQLCKKWNKPLVVVCGQNRLSEYVASAHGISRVITLTDALGSVDAALSDPVQALRTAMDGLLD